MVSRWGVVSSWHYHLTLSLPQTKLSLACLSQKYARRILKCAPLAIQATKQCAFQGLEYASVHEAMQAQQNKRFDKLERMMQSRDIREGLRAFMEKRKPHWQGG